MKAVGREPSGIGSPVRFGVREGRNRTARAVPLRFEGTIKAAGREPSGIGFPVHFGVCEGRNRTARAVPLILGVTDVF